MTRPVRTYYEVARKRDSDVFIISLESIMPIGSPELEVQLLARAKLLSVHLIASKAAASALLAKSLRRSPNLQIPT
jgi:hypothetical protein